MDIPGYSIEKEIGKGGMATVYLATQLSLNRRVALKVMNPALAAGGDFTERFLSEARTIAQMNHPGIIAVYDVGVHDHYHFIAMELVDGGDLKRRIKQGALKPEIALNILAKVATALGYAHGKGYVHRDIKPENILFRSDGQPVITDFGIARSVDSNTRLTGVGLSVGTPHYMSPEQAMGKKVDGRADLYSLGVVLYEMLTGSVPYDADSTLAIAMAHVTTPLPRLPEALGQYQPILDAMLSKEPEQRVADTKALLALMQTREQPSQARAASKIYNNTQQYEIPAPLASPSPSPSPSPSQPFVEQLKTNRAWQLVAATTVVVMLVMTGMALFQQPEPAVQFSGSSGFAAAPRNQIETGRMQEVNQPGKQQATTDVEAILLRRISQEEGVTGADNASSSPVHGVDVQLSPEQIKEARITLLLEQAKTNMATRRLTLPAGDNAYEKFLKVQELEPDHPVAAEGILTIGKRYRGMAEKAYHSFPDDNLSTELLDKATGFLQKALSIAPELSSTNDLQSLIDTARNELKSLNEFEPQLEQLLNSEQFDQADALITDMAGNSLFTNEMGSQANILLIDARKNSVAVLLGDFVTIPAAHYKLQRPEFIRLEVPDKQVYFTDFQLSTREVTREQFTRFVDETNYRTDAEKGEGCATVYNKKIKRWEFKRSKNWKNPGFSQQENEPVVCVSFGDVQAYIAWLNKTTSDTFRLPTAAEWQYAATSGGQNLDSVWDDFKAHSSQAHCNGCNTPFKADSTIEVGHFPANKYGLQDMFGNVREWVDECARKDVLDTVVGGALNIIGNIGGAVLNETVGVKTRQRDVTCPYKGVMGLGWYEKNRERNLARLTNAYPESASFQRGFRLVKR